MFAFLDVLVPRGKKYGEREHHLKIGRFTIDAKNNVYKIGLKMYVTFKKTTMPSKKNWLLENNCWITLSKN